MTKGTKRMLVIGGMLLALALGMVVIGQTEQQAVSAQSPDGHSLDAADGDPTDTVFVDNDGNVGIRTTNTKATLDINGHVNVQDGNNAGVIYFPQSGNLPNLYIRSDDDPSTYEEASERLFVGGNGNVGIGTANPLANLDVVGHSRLGTGIADSWFPYPGDGWAYVSGRGIVFRSDAAGGYAERMKIEANGNVGIGTSNPQHKLSVKGTAQATEVVIADPEDFPDFVFEDGYKLMPLAQLEEYINQNGHLPDVPSAEEVGEQGLQVGEMQTSLLQKIEELTLYVIDLKKENDALKEQLEALQK
jgi:hypothetical protein